MAISKVNPVSGAPVAAYTVGQPVSALPKGVTFRNMYTTTTTGISGQPDLVFVVMSGGGAGGSTGDYGTVRGGGGGCGNIWMGWMPSFTSVTIGAGGTIHGGIGGHTYVGAGGVIASGGVSGNNQGAPGLPGGVISSNGNNYYTTIYTQFLATYPGAAGGSGGNNVGSAPGGSMAPFLTRLNSNFSSYPTIGVGGNGGTTPGTVGNAGAVAVFW